MRATAAASSSNPQSAAAAAAAANKQMLAQQQIQQQAQLLQQMQGPSRMSRDLPRVPGGAVSPPPSPQPRSPKISPAPSEELPMISPKALETGDVQRNGRRSLEVSVVQVHGGEVREGPSWICMGPGWMGPGWMGPGWIGHVKNPERKIYFCVRSSRLLECALCGTRCKGKLLGSCQRLWRRRHSLPTMPRPTPRGSLCRHRSRPPVAGVTGVGLRGRCVV